MKQAAGPLLSDRSHTARLNSVIFFMSVRRVAHLVFPAEIGGVETVVQLLATGRSHRGFPTEVIALTSLGSEHPLVKNLESAGVPVTVRPPLGRRYLSEARAVATVVRERGIDVLHTHVYRADFVGYRAARSAGIPVVSTFHGETGGDWKNRLYEWAVKRLFRRVDAVICVSERNREKLSAAGSDLSNVHVIANAASFAAAMPRSDARDALQLPRAAKVVAWIGRLSQEKGPDLMLQTYSGLRVEPVHLVFIGDGPMRAELERNVPERLRHQVRFVGSLYNAARLLPAFDVLAISSRTEGMPMVLLEAMASGVPVAAFQVGGIPELLTEQTGWPAAPEDPDSLARAIDSALASPDESARRAASAELLVRKKYSMDGWLAAIERVYDSVSAAPALR